MKSPAIYENLAPTFAFKRTASAPLNLVVSPHGNQTEALGDSSIALCVALPGISQRMRQRSVLSSTAIKAPSSIYSGGWLLRWVSLPVARFSHGSSSGH